MGFKTVNREWVKTAAIIFLAVLLMLTFFSNTIMNRTLPEVATAYITSGSITAKVRGSGTVSANGLHEVRAEQTREIRSVMVKSGQEVKAGDVLFVLGQGDSEELETAQDTLRQLELNYQRAAVGMPSFDYSLQERQIKQAEEKRNAAEEAVKIAKKEMEDKSSVPVEELERAEAELAAAIEEFNKADATYTELFNAAQELIAQKQAVVDAAIAEYNAAVAEKSDPVTEEEQLRIDNARAALAAAQTALELEKIHPEVTAAQQNKNDRQADIDAANAKIDAMLSAAGEYKLAYDKAREEFKIADDELYNLKYQLNQDKNSNNKSLQLSYIDLGDIATQIEKQKKKIQELSGGIENEVIARVAGTIQSVDCTAGNKVPKDELLCTIEVPDMGYTMSFTATSDQARRLRIGDTATVSNFYWGNQIIATLNSIKPDPKSPQNGKLLTFDLTGDVTAGSELTISVGQKSATYDTIIPNSSIRSDSNGSFVLVVNVKNSPLGNRYIAERVGIEVLASDDINSAVTGGLNNGDYVITTSNSPIKNGDQVRMADS